MTEPLTFTANDALDIGQASVRRVGGLYEKAQFKFTERSPRER